MVKSGSSRIAQLPLNVQLRDESTFDNFLASPASVPLLSALRQQCTQQGEPIIYAYGPADAGKSHLLQACCHAQRADTVQYLPLVDLQQYSPDDVFQGLENLALVCLDDVERVLHNEAWELALFHLINRARARSCRLLLSGNAAPRALAVTLADLRSRLAGGLVYHLFAATDEQLAAVLRFRADRRGLSLAPAVARYIVSRAPRVMSQLLALLDDLDRLSLVEQRALTVPFVKQALGW